MSRLLFEPCAVFVVVVLMASGVVAQQGSRAAQIAAMPNPYLMLIRDAAVHSDLGLSERQIDAIRGVTDEVDQPLLASRNRAAKEADQMFQDALAKAQPRMNSVLDENQRRRLDQIALWVQGTKGLLRDDVGEKLKLDDKAKQEIRSVIEKTRGELAELSGGAKNGRSEKSVERESADLLAQEQRQILALLTTSQRRGWRDLLGDPFTASRLGKIAFKAPELPDSPTWINSKPLTLAQLRGKVVALHFYTFG